MAIGGQTEAAPARPRPFWAHLYVQVLVAIIAGALLGHVAPGTGEALKPLGDGFIRLVKMVIAPVIFLTLVSGIAGLGELKGVGRVAAKALGYFLVVSTLALLVGLAVGNLVRPGAGMNIDPATLDTARWPSSPARRTTPPSPASCSRSSRRR
jgi:aerobic C4-dicarboxylate transport protein